MEFQHIWAIALRHIRLWMKDFNLILITLYWPLLDVLIWGFLGSWMQKAQQTNADYSAIFLFCILLWQVNSRAAIVTVSSFLEEIWSFNLINMFSMPLRIGEWICGVALFNFLLSIINALYCISLIVLFYKISILLSLKILIIFGPPLFISGIWLGFTSLHVIAYFGKRAQELSWIIAWFFAPLSGAFYPIDVFPSWIQKISYLFPMTYIFEGLRNYLMHGINPTHHVIVAYALAIPYASIAIGIFVLIFNRTKVKGLVRLSD